MLERIDEEQEEEEEAGRPRSVLSIGRPETEEWLPRRVLRRCDRRGLT